MKKSCFFKNMMIIGICVLLMMPAATVAAAEKTSKDGISLSGYETFLHEKTLTLQIDSKALHYIKTILSENELNSILKDYELSSRNTAEAYERFQGHAGRIYAEVQANGFNQEQAAALFKSGAKCETGKIKTTEFVGVIPAGPSAPAEKIGNPDTLPYQMYVNSSSVPIHHAFIYNGRTYVELRELASATNMAVTFVKEHQTPPPGGGLLEGVHISQPTFVYTKDRIVDTSRAYGPGGYIHAVDIDDILRRYDIDNGHFSYAFVDKDGKYSLMVPDGNGQKKEIPLRVVYYMGRKYVSVDEFREKIQPYLVDICMQPSK